MDWVLALHPWPHPWGPNGARVVSNVWKTQDVPSISLIMTFTQQQLYKVQKVLVLWVCTLNDSKQNKQLAAFSFYILFYKGTRSITISDV